MVLDVPELEVDRITLEVRDLRAHVSILAELANLVNISVGVDARLDEVKLEIDGVEAEVHLVARLKNVRAILVKALDTIGEHPEILRILARSISRLVRESLEESLGTLDSALEGLEVGETVDEALLGRLGEVRAALEDVLERTERGVEGAAPRGALGEGLAGEAPSSPLGSAVPRLRIPVGCTRGTPAACCSLSTRVRGRKILRSWTSALRGFRKAVVCVPRRAPRVTTPAFSRI